MSSVINKLGMLLFKVDGLLKLGRFLLSSKREKSRQPSLNYAGMFPINKNRQFGGAVKLLQLGKEFPPSEQNGNILYLITSCLPPGAISWAQRAKKIGIPFVLNQNGVAYPAWANSDTIRRLNDRNKSLIELADYIIYQSDFCKSSCEEWISKSKVQNSIIYNPVDLDLFKLKRNSPNFHILLMGSHSQSERVMLPLQMIAYAKAQGYTWSLKIAGKFFWKNAKSEIFSFIAEHNLENQVVIHGAYSQNEAPSLYQDARVLLHLQDKDASPTVPLEAMACGTRVLGIRSGGMPELVPEKLGHLMKVPNSWNQYNYPLLSDLFEQMRKQLAFTGLETELRNHVEINFSSKIFLNRHKEIFSSLLGKF